MGTNYYIKLDYCEHCGRSDDLHVGKSSAGWCFALRIYPERGINNLGDWESLFKANPVTNESGATIAFDRLMDAIKNRSSQNPWTAEELYANHAVRGPNGLARDADAIHGPGTWDYIEREFS